VDKKLVVAGVTGGGILAFLITVFSFMSAAPWATRTELDGFKAIVTEKSNTIEQLHTKDLARVEAVQQNMATKQDVTLLLEMMREIKQDVKSMRTK